MFINYLKSAIRNISRHKVSSFISVMGLAAGMAFSTPILLWGAREMSYDRFHENKNEIYRVLQEIDLKNHRRKWALTQGPLGPALKKEIPEIINACRVKGRSFLITRNDKRSIEPVGMTDPSISEMFTFPLTQGDPAAAIREPDSIIISEAAAEKYFGDEDPVGQALWLDLEYEFRVTGVMKNIPWNSSLRADFVISIDFDRERSDSLDRWNNSELFTFVQLDNTADPADVVQKISTFLADKPVSPENARLNLQPLLTLRRSSDVEFDSFSSAKPWGNVVILFGVAALILLVACVNYISMTAAGFIHRAREIGMRISLGAARGDIIRQLITESVLPALLAVFPAMAMVELLLPMADDPAVVSLPGDILFRFEGIAGLTAMALTTGLIAGIYPALRLSSLRPATVIKRPSPSASRGAIFQKILVIIQFTIAVFLIICALVIYRQHQYAQRKDLGYEKSEMIYTHLHDATRKNLRAIKRELRQSPHIIRMTTSTSEQTRGFRFSSSLWRWEGQRPDERRLIRSVYVGDDFFRTFNMDMVNGRYFVDRPTRGGPPAAIINEATAEIMGMHSPVGKHLTINDARLEIIGVIKNYHFRSLRRKIEPLIILRDPGQSRVLFIKIHSGRLPRALVDIRAIWGKYAPGLPFEYQLMDAAVKNLYRFEEALASILRVFSFLAVLLSCLGLFGLASFIVERRTKEIGVRKALGASTGSIVRLLSREFAACVLIANLLACPMAAYFCTKWLGNYAYHVALTPWPFLLAAALTFGTAAVAVSLQTIKAAAANPVDAIRCE